MISLSFKGLYYRIWKYADQNYLKKYGDLMVQCITGTLFLEVQGPGACLEHDRSPLSYICALQDPEFTTCPAPHTLILYPSNRDF